MPALIEIRNITKSYPGVIALDNVSMEIKSGEIHALMGENGAGKSTLVKVITGVTKADAGEIIFQGESIIGFSPAEILNLGISVIFQDINLIQNLTVAENIFLARLPGLNKIFFDKRVLQDSSRKILHELDINISENDKVGDLSALNRKMVAVARSLTFRPKLIIMDEPTAALSRHEIQILFEKIRALKAKGVSFLYISHFLEEVFDIADQITVIRDGKKIGTERIKDVTPDQIVYMMVGHTVDHNEKDYSNKKFGSIVLSVSNLVKEPYVSDISFELQKGEILGITGPAGSGKTALARIIFGVDRPENGMVKINNKNVNFHIPSDAIYQSIGYVPQDRHLEGLLLNDSITRNISLPSINKLSKIGFVQKKKEQILAENYCHKLSVKAKTMNMQVQFLSGGNQQKVSIAKWLALNPEIIIFDEPTQGIDVVTKQEIYNLINGLAKAGLSVVFMSSEPTELTTLCDRVIIIRRGKVANILSGKEISRGRIIKEITGAKEAGKNGRKTNIKILSKR